MYMKISYVLVFHYNSHVWTYFLGVCLFRNDLHIYISLYILYFIYRLDIMLYVTHDDNNFLTCVRNTEKSSPQAMYLTLMERNVFNWAGYLWSISLFNPNWPNLFLPQPNTAPAKITSITFWKLYKCSLCIKYNQVTCQLIECNIVIQANSTQYV